MMRKKTSAVLAGLMIASIASAPHLAHAQVPSATSLPDNGPITSLTAPIDLSTAAKAVSSNTTVTGTAPATTASIATTSNAAITQAQKSTMYTQTETQITVLQAQQNAMKTTGTPAQLASIATSIANCQTRATLLDPTQNTVVTGNTLNTYHCP